MVPVKDKKQMGSTKNKGRRWWRRSLPEEEEERKKRKERKGKNEMSGPPFSIIREGITKFMKLPTYPYINI